jgi:hypothetical protein
LEVRLVCEQCIDDTILVLPDAGKHVQVVLDCVLFFLVTNVLLPELHFVRVLVEDQRIISPQLEQLLVIRLVQRSLGVHRHPLEVYNRSVEDLRLEKLFAVDAAEQHVDEVVSE